MVRTQVQLPDEQFRALKRLAAERGVSMAEVVRDGISAMLVRAEREQSWERAFEVMGRFRGGGGNVAEDHDRYLEDAYSG